MSQILTLRSYQVAALDSIRFKFAQGTKKVLLWLPTGAGKCHGAGTPILMYDGTIKPVEDVAPGDLLMGPDSKPRRVSSTARGREMMYRVVPTKGEPWTCNESHVLSLVSTATGRVSNVSVRDLFGKNRTFRHEHKLYRTGVDWPEQPAPFDPYAVGLYLAEGSTHAPQITNPDPEILDWLSAWALKNEMLIRDEPGSGCRELYFKSMRQGWFKNHADQMRKALCKPEGRRVPPEYIRTSRDVRLKVLAGLLDGDGHLTHGGFEIITKHAGLKDDILFLARSLGFAAYASVKRATIKSLGFEGWYHRVYISGDVGQIPCIVPKKKATPRRQVKDVLRTGFTLEPIGEGDYYGFEIDGDHLYLLGDFTVTHNTVIFCRVLDGAVKKGKKAIAVVQGVPLIDNMSSRMFREGIDHGVLQGDHWARNDQAPIQVCSIDTLYKRKIRPPADLVVVDEAHLASQTDKWLWLVEQYPDAFWLPVTATPYVQGGLRHLADDFVHPVSHGELVELGYLAEARYFAPTKIDLTGVKIDKKTGDYETHSLSAALDGAGIYGDVVKNYKTMLQGAPAMAFAVDIKHSHMLRDRFLAAGIRCEHVDANTPDAERNRVLKELDSGALQVVTNVGVMTTGVDVPNLMGVILCRPTKSTNLYIQMVGRGTRRPPGKTHFFVFDHVNNVREHGFVEDERELSLDGGDGKRRAGDGTRHPICCVKCYGFFERSDTFVCPYCGHDNKAEAAAERKIEEHDAEMREITERAAFELKQNGSALDRWIGEALLKNYEAGWVFHRVRMRFGNDEAKRCWSEIQRKFAEAKGS